MQRRDITDIKPDDLVDGQVFVDELVLLEGDTYRELYLIGFDATGADMPVFTARDQAVEESVWFFEWDEVNRKWMYGGDGGPVKPGMHWLIGPIPLR